MVANESANGTPGSGYRAAVDVGGTFTDVVALDIEQGSLIVDKVETTPSEPSVGVLESLAKSGAPMDAIEYFVHGTTLALNALLTRSGAKVAIVTTTGFRDVFELGRTDREPMYDLTFRKPPTLVPRSLVFEVPERLAYDGSTLLEIDTTAAEEVARRIGEAGAEAVAVCFLHSYANPAHEIEMGRILEAALPDIDVTLSHQLLRVYREYERTSTSVLDAYVKPVVRHYLGVLEGELRERHFSGHFLMMGSGGGAMTVTAAKGRPVNLVLSGPAGGVVGAAAFAELVDAPNLITIDMGGTSLDASIIIDGRPTVTASASFQGLPVSLPTLDINTIGAGGGSIGWVDEGDHLQVGPQSAGAEPGPASYGKGGTEPTVTDAALAIGYLGSDTALGGGRCRMTRLRLGIDVGGTNTDAVVVDDAGSVLAWIKVPTTPDPMDGIRESIEGVLPDMDKAAISQVMLGTTHPANAIIQRKGLDRIGILRLAAPSSLLVRPALAWPRELEDAILGPTAIIEGGFEYDGSEIAPLDEDAVRAFAAECRAAGIKAIAVSCAFSPANYEHEDRAGAILEKELGDSIAVTLSHEIGSLGLLEREDAAALNASLLSVSRAVVDGLSRALEENELDVRAYLTQNDGTLMTAKQAVKFPVLTVGSGPTNSMRGASALAGLSDALVMDVGGTSTDVGILVDGFPRESSHAVEVGGVRTNFRMPDLISIGMGGGTIIHDDGRVGPDSVGYRVITEALVMGGLTPTLSDASVKAGRLDGFGDAALAEGLDADRSAAAIAWVDDQVQELCDRLKASRQALPLIAVGGGSHLVADDVPGVSEVIKPPHFAVANAYGAAIAEASGEVDRVYRYDSSSREECIEDAKRLAIEAAERAGADPAQTRITTIMEVPMTYVPGGACRVQVKAAGPLATEG